MKSRKLAILTASILIAAIILPNLAFADEWVFSYAGKTRKWYWANKMTFDGVHIDARSDNRSYYKTSTGSWALWAINEHKTWVRLTSPLGASANSTYNYSDKDTTYNSSSAYAIVNDKLTYWRGQWNAYSTHRFWGADTYRLKTINKYQYF